MEAWLHRWHVEPAEIERHLTRRGRQHAFERLIPAQTALVVVDMIPFFVGDHPYALGIVPNIDRLARVLRDAGGTVAWVVPAVTEPTEREREFFGGEVAARYAASGGDGEPLTRLTPHLTAHAEDLVLEKRLRGAFFPGSSELDVELFRRSIDTVLVAGTAADICCESTVREAASLGYRTIMVTDAVAAGSDDVLNATLRTVYRSFGDVRSTDDLVSMLAGGGEGSAQPS